MSIGDVYEDEQGWRLICMAPEWFELHFEGKYESHTDIVPEGFTQVEGARVQWLYCDGYFYYGVETGPDEWQVFKWDEGLGFYDHSHMHEGHTFGEDERPDDFPSPYRMWV